MIKISRIGVLTSGGDSPGMNASVRAVVRTASEFALEVVGIRRGYNGLLAGDTLPLDSRSVGDIIQRGGTMLYTARCLEFLEARGQKRGFDMAQKLGLGGLVVIGGDGSFRGAAALNALGLPAVGLPGTIDNDIACTDYSIGFDTACNIAMEAVDRLRDTTQSHEKCSVVEVMGRRAGHLALYVAVATGATAALVPEKEYDIKKDVCEKISASQKSGKTHHIVIVAEGCKDGVQNITEQIEKETGISTRLTVLGHIQRGGAPTVLDRVNATRMGHRAVELLKNGVGGRLVSIRSDAVVDYGIDEGLSMKKTIDETLYSICKTVSK